MTGWKRPTVATKFHIDNEWWQTGGKDLRVTVRAQLCKECQARFPDHRNLESVDWVDPETAEVIRADALLQTIRSHCAQEAGFIGPGNSLLTNVFRVFLLNSNQPLTPAEMHQQMPWASADMILRTLTAGQIYLGLRPATNLD